jgi:mRNA-degrading endonuclease RelE of RelBE toxin-antitoxin system
MYTITFEPGAYRLFKKFTPDLREQFKHQAEILKEDPLSGTQLQGRFRHLRSLHFSYKGTTYRIIYTIVTARQEVAIQLADKRENIYKRLEEMGL